jgi:short-subunit dehydrogenase
MAMSGWFLDVPRERWEALLQVNLLAAMRLAALFAPGMVARGSGHIVNISSVAGFIGTPGLAAYSTAKFGLRGFSEALALELRPHSVCVTGVYPFFAKTPILESPHYGAMPRGTLPDRMVHDPDRVMAVVLRGIQRNATHVYPDPTARVLNVLQHVAPWLVRRVGRRAPTG